MKSTAVSYLLWLLGGFGVLGLHRFYLGRWVTGLIWLLTGGLLGIGAIIDLFVITPMVRVENLSRHLLSHVLSVGRARPSFADRAGRRAVRKRSTAPRAH
ncbi:MAG: NINE protein [Planctomycetes bacterium]|nr:NINE protein [Planctomycetota bacterium]